VVVVVGAAVVVVVLVSTTEVVVTGSVVVGASVVGATVEEVVVETEVGGTDEAGAALRGAVATIVSCAPPLGRRRATRAGMSIAARRAPKRWRRFDCVCGDEAIKKDERRPVPTPPDGKQDPRGRRNEIATFVMSL